MTDHPVSSATPLLLLLLRLVLGALLLSLACLTLAALCVPAFAADLAAQGMPAPLSWPALLLEWALGAWLIVGVHGGVAHRARAAAHAG